VSKKVPITTATQLLEALESTDFSLQAAVMQAISKDPAKALSYGRHEGRDVVDALIAMGSVRESTVALLPCTTLSAFDEPRVVDFFLDRLAHGTGKVVALATGYLMRHEILRERVYGIVMENESLLRVRSAARLLGPPMPVDPPEVALRLALMLPNCTLPPLNEAWEPRWLEQLESVIAGQARAGIESLPEKDTLPRMISHWSQLGLDNQRWLLEWGVRSQPEQMVEFLKDALQTDPAFVLGLLQKVPEAVAPLRDHLPMEHVDPRIRRWARSLAGPVTESDPKALLAALRHTDWQVRAEACEALIARGGTEIVLAVRPLATSDRLEVRAAAAQILMALGEQEWMEETLLAR
jgi:hypothetical protein